MDARELFFSSTKTGGIYRPLFSPTTIDIPVFRARRRGLLGSYIVRDAVLNDFFKKRKSRALWEIEFISFSSLSAS
jgi:hypothetical protein